MSAPTGTVTLLFTDIEGSTRLLAELGERYLGVLEDHHRLLREAIAAHAGHEVDTEGDAFFVSFARARDAIACAARGQRALASHSWPKGLPVRVRMGLHTGEPMVSGGRYIGLDVHRAARVMSAGHGGQVLVSQSTHDLVHEELPTGISLRDLGEHRLKDLTLPQRLWQLCLEGLPAAFPALKTLENRPTNLPAQPTQLIGRQTELRELQALLLREDVRLVTLTGSGGTGKTRLALQLAAESVDHFAAGVYFVALAPIRDAGLVLPTIAQTLGLREAAGQTLAETLADYLRERQLLLLLDNLEQLLDAAPQLAELLQNAPTLKLVATSRAPLRLAGEHERAVPPLQLPEQSPNLAVIARSEAVGLFVERAGAVRADFKLSEENAVAVAAICARLDGLPLAIELAAARVRALPPRALLERLDRSLQLLTGGPRDAPERQRTLRAAVAWSYELLLDTEQALFRRLGVFVGGFTLEAAEAVCDADDELDAVNGIDSLVAASLVRPGREVAGETRYSLLETIREYACEWLRATGEAEQAERRHGEWFLALAEAAEEGLLVGDEPEVNRIARELDNVRATLTRALARGDRVLALRLAGALKDFWWVRAQLEGRRWLEEALALCADAPTEYRINAVVGASSLAALDCDWELAEAHSKEGIELARAHDDKRSLIFCLNTLISSAIAQNDLERVAPLVNEVLEAADGADPLARGFALGQAGYAASSTGDLERSVKLLEEAAQLNNEAGDRLTLALNLQNLSVSLVLLNRYVQATATLAESCQISTAIGDERTIAANLDIYATIAAGTAQFERAATLSGAAASVWERLGITLEGTPVERAMQEQARQAARAALGDERFREHYSVGYAMSADDSVRYALTEQT